MKILNVAVVAVALILMSGCASVSTSDIVVDAKAAPTVDLNGYKTYAWLGEAALLHDPEKKWQPPKMNVAGDIKYLIDRELRKRKIYSTVSEPELAVVFFMGIDMEAMKLKMDPAIKKEMMENVPKAALVIALIDTKTKLVVWIGRATAELHENPSDEMVRERLDYAVTQIMKKMPRD
jgi:uncharacterized protein YceK